MFSMMRRAITYAICGDGAVDVIEQIDRDTYKTSARVATATGTRTGLFVPEQRIPRWVPQLGTQGPRFLIPGELITPIADHPQHGLSGLRK